MIYLLIDLQVDLYQLFVGLGYYIVGDDEWGWGYIFGFDDSGCFICNGLDIFVEVVELVLQDFMMCVGDLVGVGGVVVEQWEILYFVEVV